MRQLPIDPANIMAVMDQYGQALIEIARLGAENAMYRDTIDKLNAEKEKETGIAES